MTLLFILLIASALFSVIMLIKNENTFKQFMIITDAIYQYNIHNIENGEWEDGINIYDHMKSYEYIVFRIFDWGYENILPKDDMDKIRPFIKGVKE